MVSKTSQVSVLIPVGGECPHRRMALDYILRWYSSQHPGYQLVCGVPEPGQPWCKAEAVAHAAREATGNIFVIADADSWTDRLTDAVSAVESGWSWAMPHYAVHRLNRKATDSVYRGIPPDRFTRTSSCYSQSPYVGIPGGGITVLPRETYESAPLDPEFRGWGQEDEAWAMALRVLFGRPWRPSRDAPLWHLWHPPQNRISRATGSDQSREVLFRYKQARTPELMSYRLLGARKFYQENVVTDTATLS